MINTIYITPQGLSIAFTASHLDGYTEDREQQRLRTSS